MLINVKTCAGQDKPSTISLEIQERLPSHIEGPCLLTCGFSVKNCVDYYLLSLKTTGPLRIICQRCLQTFVTAYEHEMQLAVCDSEPAAEQLMNDYDSVVAKYNQIDLVELLTDDLHLYSPVSHPDSKECDTIIDKFLVKTAADN